MSKQYRVQRSDYLGMVDRGWGFGRASSWGRWRTVASRNTLEAAEADYAALVGKGLARTRLVYGKETLRKSD